MVAQLLKKKTILKNESIVLAASRIAAKPYYIMVLIIWGLYLYLLYNSPNTTSNQLQIPQQTLDLLRITVAVPYLLIWLAAMYSYTKIKRYAIAIKPSVESSAFDKIANGIFFLLISLILSTIASSLRNYLVDYTQWRPALTILTNYAFVLPYLFAFFLLMRGTVELVSQYENFRIPYTKYLIFSIPLVLFTFIWLELIFTNESRVTSGEVSKFASYYLKDSLLVLTIVIPSLVTWVIGLRTILKIWVYHKIVKGIIYRQALTSFIYGLMGVILGSILLQSLLSLGAQRLLKIGLSGVLQIIYLFIIIQVIGFFLIARGANKLTKIEEV